MRFYQGPWFLMVRMSTEWFKAAAAWAALKDIGHCPIITETPSANDEVAWGLIKKGSQKCINLPSSAKKPWLSSMTQMSAFYQEKIKHMRKPLGYVKIIFTNYSLYRIPQFISSAWKKLRVAVLNLGYASESSGRFSNVLMPRLGPQRFYFIICLGLKHWSFLELPADSHVQPRLRTLTQEGKKQSLKIREMEYIPDLTLTHFN